MNIAHYVAEFELQATEKSKSFKNLVDSDISSIDDSSSQILEEWKLPHKINLIEQMVCTATKNQISRQGKQKKLKQVKQSKNFVFFVGKQDSPHITALLYSILYLIKYKGTLSTPSDIDDEDQKSVDSEQYQQNYLIFKYQIYKLAQKVLSSYQISVLVDYLSNLYYSTEVINFLCKNTKFIHVFEKIFKFSCATNIPNIQAGKKSLVFINMQNFMQRFTFLKSNIYDYRQTSQYFKEEYSPIQSNYDLMEISLSPCKNSIDNKLNNVLQQKLFIIRESKCYFILHFKQNCLKQSQKSSSENSHLTQFKSKINYANSNTNGYSTPKFILSRSKKVQDTQQQIIVRKFDKSLQNSPKCASQSEKTISNVILTQQKKQQASTQYQLNNNQNNKNMSTKYFGSSNNLTSIPQQGSVNNQFHKRLAKVDLFSCSRFAQLITSNSKQKKKTSTSQTSINTSPIKYRNLINKYQNCLRDKQKRRQGQIYESLKVGVSCKNHTNKKIRETLNIRLTNYKNFTKKNISEKLKSPRNRVKTETINLHSDRNLPKQPQIKYNQVKKQFGLETTKQKYRTQFHHSPQDFISKTSIDKKFEPKTSNIELPQTNIVTQTIITNNYLHKCTASRTNFAKKVNFIYNRPLQPFQQRRSNSPKLLPQNTLVNKQTFLYRSNVGCYYK